MMILRIITRTQWQQREDREVRGQESRGGQGRGREVASDSDYLWLLKRDVAAITQQQLHLTQQPRLIHVGAAFDSFSPWVGHTAASTSTADPI